MPFWQNKKKRVWFFLSGGLFKSIFEGYPIENLAPRLWPLERDDINISFYVIFFQRYNFSKCLMRFFAINALFFTKNALFVAHYCDHPVHSCSLYALLHGAVVGQFQFSPIHLLHIWPYWMCVIKIKYIFIWSKTLIQMCVDNLFNGSRFCLSALSYLFTHVFEHIAFILYIIHVIAYFYFHVDISSVISISETSVPIGARKCNFPPF